MDDGRAQREFHILLWGVTGWTGVHLLEYFVKNYPQEEEDAPLRWAMVARNPEKLEKAINQVSEEYKADWLSSVQTFLVDNSDGEMIRDVVTRSQSVATVVGPYAKYGELLLKTCVEAGTHYCDITGESPWVKEMIGKYHDLAEANGTFIVPGSGFDSVPSDLTCYRAVTASNDFVCQKYGLTPETLTEVPKKFKLRGYFTRFGMNNRATGSSVSPGGGTIASLGGVLEDHGLKTLDNPFLLTGEDDECVDDKSHTPQRWVGRNSRIGSSKWTTHFLMAYINEKVVRRSRYLMPQIYGTGLSYHEAMAFKYPFTALGLAMVFSMVYTLMGASFTRKRLLKSLPSPGQFPPPRPEGYKPGDVELVVLCDATYNLPGNDGQKVQKVKVAHKATFALPDEGGYTETSKMLGESCLALVQSLEDVRNESGLRGGVVTPACLGSTLIERLVQKEATMEVQKL